MVNQRRGFGSSALRGQVLFCFVPLRVPGSVRVLRKLLFNERVSEIVDSENIRICERTKALVCRWLGI